MDPSRNNMPLNFDKNKGKPPMPVVLTNSDNQPRDMSSSAATAEAIAAATAAASSTNSMMTNTQYNMAQMATSSDGPKQPLIPNLPGMGGGPSSGNMGGGPNMGGGSNMGGPNTGGGPIMGGPNTGGGPNMGNSNMGGGPNNMGGGLLGSNMGGPNMGGGPMGGNMGGPNNMGGGLMGGPNNMGGGPVGGGPMGGGPMGGGPMGGNMSGPNNMGGGPMGGLNNMGGGPMGGNVAGNMGGAMIGPMGPVGPNMMMGPLNFGQAFAGLLGPMGPLGMMGPGPEGMGMGLMGPGPTQGPMLPQKEVITLKACVLMPPHPEAPQHSVRERPPGCRTAFVGGLPENVTEEILEEVFEKSGPIESIRLGKKNFAHIRFIKHESVEQAMYLSGYRMKIENKDDKPNTGRIHVDYANARNDQYEYECEQRALAREMRHQQQIQKERLRPPSPPLVAPFTIYEGSALLDVIKTDSGFMKASQQLVTWLDRGNVDKRSANLFYSLVQSSNAHVRRLVTEKQQHEEEVNQAKLLFKQRVQGIIVQLGQIESVFTASLKQRNWDHFTKAQRKNIDTWYKQVKEIRQSQQAQFLNERSETEMDMSDNEAEDSEAVPKKKRKASSLDGVAASMEAADQLMMNGQLHSLKEENDSLKCQLDAYVNEAEMVKLEAKHSTEALEKQVKSLQQALQGMQQQLILQQTQTRNTDNKSPASDRRNSTTSAEKIADAATKDAEDKEGETSDKSKPAARSQDSSISSSGVPLTEKEARMLGLICCFLNVHPSGATVDYLWSYLSQFHVKIRPREIEDLLDRLPGLFKQELAGVGATLERRWCFIGYNSPSS